MNIPRGWDNAQAFDGNFEQLPAGGHVCRIMSAKCETFNGSEQLALALEIAEGGKYDGYYARQYEQRSAAGANAKWPCIFRQFVLTSQGDCSPYFKGLISCVEQSNHGYKWAWQEATLKDKMIGVIFREEEYVNQRGTVSVIVRPAFIRSVQKIRDGVEVPEIKRLQKPASGNAPSSGAYTPVEDDEMPF